MSAGSVPFELLLLALVGLAGFLVGFWLRRRGRTRKASKAMAFRGPSRVVTSAFEGAPEAERFEPIALESAATLAAASQAMQQRTLLPRCPTCGSRMELRIFKEKKIWVCEEFPVCRGATLEDSRV